MKKSPLKSPKNFSATDAGRWASAPKATYQPTGRTARCLFEKSPLLTPRKTFRQLMPECRACTPKATYQPIRRTVIASPRRSRICAESPKSHRKAYFIRCGAISAISRRGARINPGAPATGLHELCPPLTAVRREYNFLMLHVRRSAPPLFWRCRTRCRNRWN